ncbi:signal transduction histidine kinase [Chitinophaga skermanii]|uniref:histidine kinase n=1 Tax=Chitinophaga skermanii TaxID=331697 RepID=A0A327QMZ7_9BACT|nr:HAMP domain-containing sensor histidine kinase [Chitinophaga skermanii]RAJ05418.1 signal transduction histidine kinase [Chitinophaga skermanii]
MSLKRKLVYRSTLVFFACISFVLIGTYLLFHYSIEESYRKKLHGIAKLAAYFYLEKDELNATKHKRIEREFKKISGESVQLYNANSKTIYIADSLPYIASNEVLSKTIEEGVYTFKQDQRQFLSMFYEDNEGDFIIIVSGEDMEGEKRALLLVHMLLIFGSLGIAMQFILSNILANKTFKPFKNLVKQVNSIKGNDLDARLKFRGKDDEIDQLVNEFNYLLERIESSAMIQRNFLRNASHEIKTPLAIILGDIEVALHSARSNEEYQALLQSLKTNSLHLKSVVESLITLSNLEVTNTKLMNEIRIDEVMWEILEKKKIEYPDCTAIVHFHPGVEMQEGLLTIQANKHLVFIAMNNIIDNAIKFSNAQPVKITLGLKGEHLCISISDEGIGIPGDELQNIFKLFYRSPQNSHIPGHGIGLYLAKQIFDLNNIQIDIQPVQPHGTTFSLVFQ